MRLALSCLVDADHADTAFFDTGRRPPEAPEPRWRERLESLCRYVRGLPAGETREERARNRLRANFFEACLARRESAPMVACEGPVGLGKTTAVTAYLLRRAMDESPNLRRLIIVAPYTNILAQTADRLRKALVLPGERADQVVVEHHHRADFEEPANRELAVLWRAPIVLTTAVSFFEALAGCDPATVRKLHSLPGSAVFLDEAHAALPTKLWPQNWLWLKQLAERWGCRFVFASGSLARFWEDGDIVREPVKLPELLPPRQATAVLDAEKQRVRYRSLDDGRCVNRETIERGCPHSQRAATRRAEHGPECRGRRAGDAAIANECPAPLDGPLSGRPREYLATRGPRLEAGWKDWTLVATSCVEAGVDYSFRSAFRERFAVASTLQIGGRVNRHGEYDANGGGLVFDFALDDKQITVHPAAEVSADDTCAEMLAAGEFNNTNPADIVTRAMREELRRLGDRSGEGLRNAESRRDYPEVARLGRVIADDTRLVVVDPRLKKRLRAGRPVSFHSLLDGSVQLWSNKIDKLGCERIDGRGHELFLWNLRYDPDFLGIMAGALRVEDFLVEGGYIV